jgi:hypothetical protein
LVWGKREREREREREMREARGQWQNIWEIRERGGQIEEGDRCRDRDRQINGERKIKWTNERGKKEE